MDLSVQVGRRRAERQQTTVREGDLLRQRLRVARCAQPGEQPRAVAVVPGAVLALDTNLLAAGPQAWVAWSCRTASRRSAPRFRRRLLSSRTAGKRLAAD